MKIKIVISRKTKRKVPSFKESTSTPSDWGHTQSLSLSKYQMKKRQKPWVKPNAANQRKRRPAHFSKIKDTEYVFALAIEAPNPTSEAFAKQIDQLGIQGKSQLTFVIGGSLGLSQEVHDSQWCQNLLWLNDLPAPTHETVLIGADYTRVSNQYGGTLS